MNERHRISVEDLESEYGAVDVEGYLGPRIAEALVHTADMADGWGLALEPDREICRRILGRLFPQAEVAVEDDAWLVLLRATGRLDPPGRRLVGHWGYHSEPFD